MQAHSCLSRVHTHHVVNRASLAGGGRAYLYRPALYRLRLFCHIATYPRNELRSLLFTAGSMRRWSRDLRGSTGISSAIEAQSGAGYNERSLEKRWWAGSPALLKEEFVSRNTGPDPWRWHWCANTSRRVGRLLLAHANPLQGESQCLNT